MPPGRSGTGPFSRFKKGVDFELIGGRIHKHDSELLKSRLKSEGMSFTAFLQAVVTAYLNADAQLIRIVAESKRRQKTPDRGKEKLSFSKRERARIALKIMGVPEAEDGEAV